ncbi:MAG: hypothetical protein IT203_11805, partial [Fimbriimonadaceae bacterium]|nr:hypothetical protein [Fimbriimonadaceae bacterium]
REFGRHDRLTFEQRFDGPRVGVADLQLHRLASDLGRGALGKSGPTKQSQEEGKRDRFHVISDDHDLGKFLASGNRIAFRWITRQSDPRGIAETHAWFSSRDGNNGDDADNTKQFDEPKTASSHKQILRTTR